MKLLLHTCCACCGSWIPDLLSLKFDVDIFYFNPNIHPRSEYEHRLDDTKRVADIMNLKFIEGEYDPQDWFAWIKGYEFEKEGGARCLLCFEYRLRKTAEYAKAHDYEYFCTTLTIGRNKKAEVINPIGERIGNELGLEFIAKDFKKGGGVNESDDRASEFGIIRQNYCGCVFSRLPQDRYIAK